MLIEKQQLIASQELIKKDAERLVMEKKEELTKQVVSLEPVLLEAVNYNGELKSEIESLEKEVKEKENSILILQDRNYLSEVRLSKTRRYIKHRESEFNEEFNWINVDFRNKMHNMSQSRRKLEQINKCITDKHNALIGLNDFLQKKLSIAENRVKSSQINNNNINLVNNNAKMLAQTLQKEREVWKNTAERYKIKIQDLEKEKGELNVNNNSENINLVMKNTMESLVDDVNSKNKNLENITNKLEEKNSELKEVTKNYKKNEDSLKNVKNSYEKAMKKNDHEKKEFLKQIDDLKVNQKDLQILIAEKK